MGVLTTLVGVSPSYKFLVVFAPIFRLAAKVAGLQLNSTKCVIVPLAAPASTCSTSIQQWLTEHIIDWGEFHISDVGKYLGVILGPLAGELSWELAIVKYWERVCQVAACGLSPQLSILAYNTHDVSVLGYLSQFFWVPFQNYSS